jgi:hypothetical protein
MSSKRRRKGEFMESSQPKYSEAEVLGWLGQIALVLADMQARGQNTNGQLTAIQQAAMAQNLAVIVTVLGFIREEIVPFLTAGGQERKLQGPTAGDLWARIGEQAQALEQRLGVPPGSLN